MLCKPKKLLSLTTVCIAFTLLLSPFILQKTESAPLTATVKVYPNVQIQPRSLILNGFNHNYSFTEMKTLNNISFAGAGVRFAKDGQYYQVECSTSDNITVSISKWFDVYETFPTVMFTVNSENASSLAFKFYPQDKEEPRTHIGVSSWVYNNSSNYCTFNVADGATVKLQWRGSAEEITIALLGQLSLLIGLVGVVMVFLSTTLTVKALYDHNGRLILIMVLIILPIGVALILGWLGS